MVKPFVIATNCNSNCNCEVVPSRSTGRGRVLLRKTESTQVRYRYEYAGTDCLTANEAAGRRRQRKVDRRDVVAHARIHTESVACCTHSCSPCYQLHCPRHQHRRPAAVRRSRAQAPRSASAGLIPPAAASRPLWTAYRTGRPRRHALQWRWRQASIAISLCVCNAARVE